MKHPQATDIVFQFWRLMASNDFDSVAAVLSDDFILDWPQSRERIRGADRFASMNREFPANGPWRFIVHRVLGSSDEAVSDVTITDGVESVRAISFFEISDGKISQIVEYWPDTYPAPSNRSHLVELMD